MSNIWIVIPTYNERETIQALLPRLLPGPWRVLIVDDHSPDGTSQIITQHPEYQSRLFLLSRAEKNGLGTAYRDGFQYLLKDSTVSTIVQMDADGSHDPSDIPRLLYALSIAQCVIGSRYVQGGSIPHWSLFRRWLSKGGSQWSRYRLGLPIHDITGGFKAWDAALLRQTPWDKIPTQGFAFQIAMTAWAYQSGAVLHEIPITFGPRLAGQSKMSGSIITEALRTVEQLKNQSWISTP